MKNIKKMIVSAIAAVMAASAIATTAGAAEYYGKDGSYWYDGINDGIVYAEDYNGYYRRIDNQNTNAYNYSERKVTYDEIQRNDVINGSYVGYDTYYGNVYYSTDRGYYTNNGNTVKYLGQDFRFTEYIGIDQYGRKIYYRSEFGYIYLNGNTWYCLGYNIGYIR